MKNDKEQEWFKQLPMFCIFPRCDKIIEDGKLVGIQTVGWWTSKQCDKCFRWLMPDMSHSAWITAHFIHDKELIIPIVDSEHSELYFDTWTPDAEGHIGLRKLNKLGLPYSVYCNRCGEKHLADAADITWSDESGHCNHTDCIPVVEPDLTIEQQLARAARLKERLDRLMSASYAKSLM